MASDCLARYVALVNLGSGAHRDDTVFGDNDGGILQHRLVWIHRHNIVAIDDQIRGGGESRE